MIFSMFKKVFLLFAIAVGVYACGTTGQITPRETSRTNVFQKRPFYWTKTGDYSYINCTVLQAIRDDCGLIKEYETARIACLQSPNMVLYDNMVVSGFFVYTGLTYQYTSKDTTARSVPIVVRLEDWKNGFEGVKQYK